MNNVYYDTGATAQDEHNAVGDHYGVPHVSIRDSIYKDLRAGKYASRTLLSPDGLHPNDYGHGLVAGRSSSCWRRSTPTGKNRSRSLPSRHRSPPTTYENARRLTIRELSPKLEGFRADPEEKLGHLDHWKNGWVGQKPGDKITFEVDASCIAVQYRKTIRRPALRAQLVLDGDAAYPVLLDGNFDEDWGDCLYLQPILHHGEHRTHTVELTILPTDTPDATEFYLMALIVTG